ncbi:MAG: RpiB/LacA/LacB family sugar-phosphate isomerase, partial [Candidatus Bipolaricaulia bacterium]
MKIAVATDERTHLTDLVVEELKRSGHELKLFGPLTGTDEEGEEWAEVSQKLAEVVAAQECDEGVLFCWTGTGSCIAANKVPGIRAALCFDAETATGARKWNHANVLVMSLRLTSEANAKEILDAWFSSPYGTEDFDIRNVDGVR